MTHPLPPPLPRWTLSLISVLAAAGLQWLLAPWVGDEATYLLFTAAVMVSARYGGLWPGIAATLLGGLTALNLFVASPAAPGQWVLFAVFLVVGTSLSYLTESLRTATHGIEAARAEKSQAESLQVLAATSRKLAEAGPDLEAVTQLVAEQAGRLLGGAAELRLLSPDGRLLLPTALHHRDEAARTALRELFQPIPATAGSWGEALRERRSLLATTDLTDVPPAESRRYVDRLAGGSILVAPLLVRDRPLGTLSLGRPGRGAPFTAEDQSLLEGLASSAAVAVAGALHHQEEDRLQKASGIKDEFLATVAHELRTPLGAMLGWARILRDEKTDEATTSRALDAIVRNANLQTRLIADLLDISRIASGTLRVEMRPVELVSVIRAALETVRPAAEAKKVTLSSTVDAEAGPITGDPSRLQQVVWNLVSNSIKFTPAGGTVDVRVRRVGAEVEVAVEDSGPGIKPEFLPQVFEPFRQEEGRERRKTGLGLGLAIVRRIVELHGGRVAAANREEATGSVFTVHLPVKAVRPEEGAPASASPSASPEAWTGKLPSLDGVRVLVVEDEDVGQMVTAILQKNGASVLAVASVQEALACLAEMRPDVLLSDLEMSQEDGVSLIQKIRELPAEQGGGIAAVALTSDARPGDRVQALLRGFQMHLSKPVRSGEIVAVVASLAGRMKQPASSPTA